MSDDPVPAEAGIVERLRHTAEALQDPRTYTAYYLGVLSEAADEIKLLQAERDDCITFLEGLASRLNRLPRRPHLDDHGLTSAAADCRAMAAKLRGES